MYTETISGPQNGSHTLQAAIDALGNDPNLEVGQIGPNFFVARYIPNAGNTATLEEIMILNEKAAKLYHEGVYDPYVASTHGYLRLEFTKGSSTIVNEWSR